MSHRDNRRITLPSGTVAIADGDAYLIHGVPAVLTRADVEALFADSIASDGRDGLLSGCAGKRRYRNAEAAGQAASSARERSPGLLLRIYPCRVCEGFHLTKMSLGEYVQR